MTSSRSGRAVRWSVPFAIIAVVAALSALVPALAAQAKPNLPSLSAAQLLAKAQNARADTLSGTVRLTTRLGLPSLGALGARGGALTDLLAGAHDARVWRDGPDRARVALLGQLAETDWVHNGRDVWMWQSDGRRVTHLQLPADAPDAAAAAKEATEVHDATPAATPDQIAQRLLAAVTPSTNVAVRSTEYVAGRPAYGLTLTPKSASSLVEAVNIAVDGATGVPLSLNVLARGQSKPAASLAFTSFSTHRPAADLFAFRPPAHSVVRQASDPRSLLMGSPKTDGERPDVKDAKGVTGVVHAPDAPAAQPTVVGEAWDSVVVARNVQVDPRFASFLKSARTVTGSFGSGRLVRTSLLSALLLDDGRLAVGAVTPEALEAAVATVH
jgi:hypothetical protein